jgi:hypothetical protein
MRPSAAHLAWIPNPVYQEGARLGEEITHLCACIHAATYRLLVLIREFDENTYWGLPGMCSCAHWLNMQCGIGMNAAREKVRVAHALKELPGISEAFRKGELSYSKVRAMTRVANEHNEEYLLMIARHENVPRNRVSRGKAGVAIPSLQTAAGHGQREEAARAAWPALLLR